MKDKFLLLFANMIIISESDGGERLRMTVIFIIFGMRFIFFILQVTVIHSH